MSVLEAVPAVSIVLVVLIFVIAVVFYVLTSRKTAAQKKFFEELHTKLAPGQTVLFCGGMKGEIVSFAGDYARIKVYSGATIEVSRYAIQQILEG